jgi:hypothetical protein
MAFRWLLLDGPRDIRGSSDDFDSQDAAEDWMGAEYKTLLADGHLAARLMDGDDELYTMKLTPE